MAEVGQVIDVLGQNRVKVKLQRQEACAKCKACTAGLLEKEMILEAENKCNAKTGDAVEVTLEKSNFLRAVLIMYTFPLITFLLGLGITWLLTNKEGISLIVGFVALTLAFLIIKSNEKRFNNEKYRPIATRIVEQ